MVFGGRKMGALIWSSSESNCYETHGCARIGMFMFVCVSVYVCICTWVKVSMILFYTQVCVRAQIRIKARYAELQDENG